MNLGSQSSATGSFFSRFNISDKLNLNTLMYILAAILFISLAVYIYYKYVSPKLSPKYVANREIMSQNDNSNIGQKQAELLFFFANWCPHCKTAKPIWENVKSEFENKVINGYKLIFTSVDCTKESDETENMMNKYNIEGFPTIKLLKDNQIIEYDAKVTKETLEQFINTII